METQRLDKWLWFTRLVKSRTLASKLVATGKIRVNEVRVSKPAMPLSEGDVITAMIHKELKIFKVLAPGMRRGPAAEAQLLYEDLTPAPVSRSADSAEQSAKTVPVASRDSGSGRPTKRQRRETDALRRPSHFDKVP